MCNVRVMSFNIRGSSDSWDNVNAWDKRAALNVETIKRCAPDVIGFPELQSGNLETYREQLPEYDYVLGPEGGNHEPYDYNPIFWNPSRFELIDPGGFWISRTPDVHSADWETAWVRCATWVRLRFSETGESFIHLNTHLDHVSELARNEGSKLILYRISQLGADVMPAIITGDFNSIPGSSAYRIFTDNGFVDAYLASGYEEAVDSFTFYNFEGEHYSAERYGYPSSRIDWLLIRSGARKIEVKSCAFIRDNEHPLYPNDHYPVLSELAISN